MKSEAVDELRGRFHGSVITPADGGYDQARRVFNWMIDRRPAAVARCRGVVDVVTALRFGRENDLPIAIRGGGHSVAGHGTCDHGIVIDMSAMRSIHVDPTRRIVRADAGATLGDLDRDTQLHGLAVPLGQMSDTGIAGLTLNGGFGMMQRKWGLTCDNLLSVDLVTVDGQLLTASAEHNPDLFWALRGGGGNFGVVTSFTYQAHELGPTMYAGIVCYPLSDADTVLPFIRDFMSTAPEELSGDVVVQHTLPVGEVPPEHRGEPVLTVFLRYCGSPEDGERAVQPIRNFGKPIMDLVGPMPFIEVQSILDPMSPPAMHNYWSAEFVSTIDTAVIEALVAAGRELPTAQSVIQVIPFNGAVTKVSPDETAFAHRHDSWLIHVMAQWRDPRDTEHSRGWVRRTGGLLRAVGQGDAYLNLLTDDEETDRIAAFWSDDRMRRLAGIKAQYDPENLLRINHNIKPAASRSGGLLRTQWQQ